MRPPSRPIRGPSVAQPSLRRRLVWRCGVVGMGVARTLEGRDEELRAIVTDQIPVQLQNLRPPIVSARRARSRLRFKGSD